MADMKTQIMKLQRPENGQFCVVFTNQNTRDKIRTKIKQLMIMLEIKNGFERGL